MGDDISEGNSCHLSGAALPLSALRLLVPPLRLVSAAIWQTIQQKVVADYGMIEEFVSLVADIVPELLTRSQRAQLMLGLRARLILDLCRLEPPPEFELIEPHLNRMQELIESWLQEAGGPKAEPSSSNFVEFVKNLLKSPEEREHFFQKIFSEQFGPVYDEELQDLMWLFLNRLEKFLPIQTFHQVASVFDVSCVLKDCMQSVCQCDELKALLLHHKDLGQLDRCDFSLNRRCIISALNFLFLRTETLETQPQNSVLDVAPSCVSPVEEDSVTAAQINSDVDSAHLTGETTMDKNDLTPGGNETQMLPADKRGPGKNVPESQEDPAFSLIKECHVKLKRLDGPLSTNSRFVRANRGLRMKKILQEEKRELDYEDGPACKSPSQKSESLSRISPEESDNDADLSFMAPVSTCSEDDSWSYYSEDSCRANSRTSSVADSWSFYSDQDSSSFISSSAESSSNSDACKNASAPRQKSNVKENILKKPRSFLCFFCKETVNTSLTTHMKTHFPNKDYVCPQCDTRYKLLTSLLQHLKKTCFDYLQQNVDPDQPDETEKLSKCHQCGTVFRYKVSLQKHMMTHHELYCGVCQRVLRDAATLARHQTSHTPFQCPRCDRSFTVFKHLVRHCENIHKISRPFACNQCPKTFPKLRFLIKHEWQHTGHMPFQCAQCNLKFKSDADLVSHEKVHSGEKPHLCSDCGKTFARRSNLFRHLRQLHGAPGSEEKYACSQCDKSFKEKASLKKHQKSKHLNELFRYPCHCCGKMVTLSGMARHKLIHTGERPFKCTTPECDRSFRSMAEVKRHVLLHHTTERPFRCGTCGKGFVRSSDLTAHARIHSVERPCACIICGKGFLKLYSLQRHKRLSHGIYKH
ncbi:zinc finger protein 135 [Kryptolebias marmoratus]|uniref:Zinc finger protein 135-like n=1 Tax=Kryptolebias marmoratus TaxID=37003 RepID=A0A3Q2ZLG7_KRYMA|nr:zinc finger protein 135 [Kryptolebias marmoratus]